MTTYRDDEPATAQPALSSDSGFPVGTTRAIERVTNTELLESLGVAVYMTDARGVITDYNEAAAELWGRRPRVGTDEWCGSWRLYWPDGTPMRHGDCPMAITLKENRPVRGAEAIAERPDGTRAWFVPFPTPLRNAAGDLIGAVNVLVDITARKAAEQALSDNQVRLTAAQDEMRSTTDRLHRAQAAALIGTWDWDVTTNQLVWDGVEAVHGVAPGSFGGSFEAYVTDMHADDRGRVTAAISQAAATATPIDLRYRIVLPDGAIRWVAGKGSPILDEAGSVTRMIGTCQDITTEKLAEDALQEVLIQLQSANAAKDEFIGLVSHELRTPITTIMGNASVLERRFRELDDVTRMEALHDITTESQRLHHIIEDMLVLARLESIENEREPVRMEHLIAAATADHRKHFSDRELIVASDVVPMVVVRASWIGQVLRNLLSNAEKYSPPDQPIEIGLSSDAGGATVVSIRDRGPGLPDDELESIFSPFYRSAGTKGRAPGVGIGLTVCKRLIEAEDGRIWASARTGGGLDVSFALPSAGAPVDPDW